MDTKYCAFLRGVNVNGVNMKMADVVSVFEACEMNHVTTVLASGNVLFSTDKSNEQLRGVLEHAMSAKFSYDAFLFIKSLHEIETMIHNNPFPHSETYHTYIFLHEKGWQDILLTAFTQSEKKMGEEAQIVGDYFYWKIEKGATLHSEFSKILGKKQYRELFTSRNIQTIDKVKIKLTK